MWDSIECFGEVEDYDVGLDVFVKVFGQVIDSDSELGIAGVSGTKSMISVC